MTYAGMPGHKGTDTSREAAQSISSSAERLRARVLNELNEVALTADQCAARIGCNILSIRPRFSELRAKGLIVDTGERCYNESGKRAVVWKKVKPAMTDAASHGKGHI